MEAPLTRETESPEEPPTRPQPTTLKLSLTWKDKLNLELQQLTSIMVYLFAGPIAYFYIRFIKKIKIINLKAIRRNYLELVGDSRRPVLICSNHLTMFDSLYIHYGLLSFWSNLTRPNLYSWNIAAVEVFKATYYRKVLTYIGKTLPVDRQGTTEHLTKKLDEQLYLLQKGNSFTVFPEGGRSRSGRVQPENVTYGVGKIVQSLDNCTVICVYIRGHSQKAETVEPEVGDEIYLAAEQIEPQTANRGMRGARDISIQIINKIKEMEDYCLSLPDFSEE